MSSKQSNILNSSEYFLNKYKYPILFIAIGIVYFFNLFVDIMEIDAAQYALISMEMSDTKSFLQVYQQGNDYLDKPPLLFWLSSLSFIIFGISNFSYKLPSVLIAILGIYSLYRFARIYYKKETAGLSALILAACQALFLITNDIRTDTGLMGLTVFAVWQLSEYIHNTKFKKLLFASIGIGGAMLAKGPIALIIPAAAFGTDLLLKRKWKMIFNPNWLLLVLFVGIILLPMSYGLYTQFDLHPEKNVYNLQGPSGLKFYYWTQSFGRITGENYWDNDTSFFYFFHTILWDFQPWVLLFIPALFFKVKKLFTNRFKTGGNDENITTGGFILVFIALSLSNYKLPHYIFVLLPFSAVITADFLYSLPGKVKTIIAKIQFGLMHVFWLLMVAYFLFFFPPEYFFFPAFLFLVFILFWTVFRKTKEKTQKIFIPTLITTIAFNLLMGASFYPNLLKYQSGSQIGKYLKENKIENVYTNKTNLALDFYSQNFSTQISSHEIKNVEAGNYVYTDEEGLKILKEANLEFEIEKEVQSYRVTALKLPFLIEESRPETTKPVYLIKIL